MRADRLVAVLLLLQARGRVTAAEVALELEISERTARRDLEALGMAGLPISSLQGRHGGWQLAGGGRTDLSGLSAAEARALFLVAGPSSSATPEIRSALRKLVRALPEPFRETAQAASTAVLVDPSPWNQRGVSPDVPHLEAVQDAVVEGRQLSLGYVDRTGAVSTRVVHPLGLAAKGSVWYLVAGTDAGLRTFRVDRISAVVSTGERAVRPADFDLTQAWQLITSEVDRRRSPVRVRACATAATIPLCRWLFGTRLQIGPTGADGRVEVEIHGAHARALAGEIAGLGADVEVLEPAEVRERLARIGAELAAVYSDR